MQAAQILEDEARRRAFVGVPEGVYHEGELVGYELKYSDRLMMRLLIANHPAHKSTERRANGGKGAAVPAPYISDERLASLTDSQLVARTRVLRAALDHAHQAIGASDILPRN